MYINVRKADDSTELHRAIKNFKVVMKTLFVLKTVKSWFCFC